MERDGKGAEDGANGGRYPFIDLIDEEPSAADPSIR
jgi:hypothetical protein